MTRTTTRNLDPKALACSNETKGNFNKGLAYLSSAE